MSDDRPQELNGATLCARQPCEWYTSDVSALCQEHRSPAPQGEGSGKTLDQLAPQGMAGAYTADDALVVQKSQRCQERESGGWQCVLPVGHEQRHTVDEQ